MSKTRSNKHTSPRRVVREFFTEGTLLSLNNVLVNRGIAPHAIVAIIEMHKQAMAKPTPSQFRVLYEVH
jgi:hypothetical protein